MRDSHCPQLCSSCPFWNCSDDFLYDHLGMCSTRYAMCSIMKGYTNRSLDRHYNLEALILGPPFPSLNIPSSRQCFFPGGFSLGDSSRVSLSSNPGQLSIPKSWQHLIISAHLIHRNRSHHPRVHPLPLKTPGGSIINPPSRLFSPHHALVDVLMDHPLRHKSLLPESQLDGARLAAPDSTFETINMDGYVRGSSTRWFEHAISAFQDILPPHGVHGCDHGLLRSFRIPRCRGFTQPSSTSGESLSCRDFHAVALSLPLRNLTRHTRSLYAKFRVLLNRRHLSSQRHHSQCHLRTSPLICTRSQVRHGTNHNTSLSGH